MRLWLSLIMLCSAFALSAAPAGKVRKTKAATPKAVKAAPPIAIAVKGEAEILLVS